MNAINLKQEEKEEDTKTDLKGDIEAMNKNIEAMNKNMKDGFLEIKSSIDKLTKILCDHFAIETKKKPKRKYQLDPKGISNFGKVYSSSSSSRSKSCDNN